MKELKGKYFYCKTYKLFKALVREGVIFIKTITDSETSRRVYVFKMCPKISTVLKQFDQK